jgi:hypothetical protein
LNGRVSLRLIQFTALISYVMPLLHGTMPIAKSNTRMEFGEMECNVQFRKMGAHLFIFNQGGQRTNGTGKEKYGMEKLPELLADIEVNRHNNIY